MAEKYNNKGILWDAENDRPKMIDGETISYPAKPGRPPKDKTEDKDKDKTEVK